MIFKFLYAFDTNRGGVIFNDKLLHFAKRKENGLPQIFLAESTSNDHIVIYLLVLIDLPF